MVKTRQQKFILSAVMFVLMMFLSVSTAFALINQSVVRDFETEIKATNVLFTYNGNTYFDGIGTKELDIFKGEPNDFSMKVGVISSGRHTIEYSIKFEFEKYSQITSAIEVYIYEGNRYEYFCMLDQLDNHTIDGFMSTQEEQDIPIRLVYGDAASDAYASEDKDFFIKATAQASINSVSPLYSFASDEIDFVSILNNPNNAGKTVILLSDITLSSPIRTDAKIGIDLNGHKLNLEQNIIIDCKNTAFEGIGIIDSKPAGGDVYSNTGNYISIINAIDCYVVDNNINCNPTNGIVRISTVGNTYAGIYQDFYNILQKRIQRLVDGSLYCLGDDVSFLTDDLEYYADFFNLVIMDGSIILQDPATKQFYISSADDITEKYSFSFAIEYNSVIKTLFGNVVVRGNSPKAIADDLINRLPSTIRGSQYLRRYDNVTGSYIDWHIVDHFDGYLFDSLGRYKKEGLGYILDDITDFDDSQIDVYIKVFKGNETGIDGGLANGGMEESYIFYNVGIELASAAELTALIFESKPIVIFAETEYDIFSTELIAEYKDKIDLSGIEIKIVEGTDILGFLEVVESQANSGFDILRIDPEINLNQNTLQYADISITFTYGSGDNKKTHTIEKNVTISGEIAEITRYDMSYRLQSAFVGNDYTEGRAFHFYAYGALLPNTKGQSVAVLVDYKILGIAAKYVSVTYEYIRVDFADLENQVAYFVLDGGKYVLTETTDPSLLYYERKANIEILPQKISTDEWYLAEIEATLYTLDKNGNPEKNQNGQLIYVDPVTQRAQILVYDLTLMIEGIVHNSENQIADINLYNIFRDLFDRNRDGIITRREADDWDGAISDPVSAKYLVSFTSEFSGTISYIVLANIPIATLNGVQFFPKVQGLDLRNTGRVDISILQTLNNLVYLDLSTTNATNQVTNLAPLAYSDYLEYLNLNNNKVSNLEPLRYLPRLRWLLVDNNRILDFEPLTSLTTLHEFTLTGMRNASNTPFTLDLACMYDFAIIKVNNPQMHFVYTGYSIDFEQEELVGAKVMRDLEEINRALHVLYLPTSYWYADKDNVVKEYQLYWYTMPYETNLTLSYDSSGYMNYHIKSPIYDKKVSLLVSVYTGEGTKTYDFSREFIFTLESSSAAGLYIYDTTSASNDPLYLDAEREIPDNVLRSLIFENFNFNDSQTPITIKIKGGGSVTSSERNVISKQDFDSLVNNKLGLYDWTKAGITDLTGIGYLRNIFNSATELILSHNKFDDITPLLKHTDSLGNTVAGLTSVSKLTLGGNYYDFRQLIGLNSLRSLYVFESYDLDSEDALKSLYALYVSNANISIYLSNTTNEWNPYQTILPKKMQNLPSIAALHHLGQTFDLYDGQAGFKINLYDIDYTFTVTAATVYSKYMAQTSGAHFVDVTKGSTQTSGKITYQNMFVSEDAVYIKMTLTSTTTDGHSQIAYGEYYFQVLLSDVSYQIVVNNALGDPESQELLAEAVPSRDLRAAFINNFFRMVNSTASLSSLSALKNSTQGAVYFYDANTGFYHVTTNAFKNTGVMNATYGNFTYNASGSSLTIASSDSGESAIKGLRYFTNIVTLTLTYNARVGDGAELINIRTLYLYYALVDLTTININLPNLTSLTINNYYNFKAGGETDSALRFMPNLTSFQLYTGRTSSLSGNVVMYYVDDLSFLLGAITKDGLGRDTSKLATIRAYDISQAATTSIANADRVKRLYLAFKNYSSTATITYRVGSPRAKSDAGYFHVIDGEAWYCTSNTITTAELSWEGAKDSELIRTEAEDFTNLTNYMMDMGLKINGSYWTANRIYSLTSQTITLPANISKDYYGLYFDADAADAPDENTLKYKYEISWEINRVFYGGSTTKQTLAPGQEHTLYASSYPGYLVIIGTISNPPAGLLAPSFMYHFVVGSGDGIYSTVEDVLLRQYLFALEYGSSKITTTISFTGDITSVNIYSALGKTKLAQENYTRTTTSVKGLDTVVAYWGTTRSTTGLDKITSVTIRSLYSTDITPLYSFVNLATLDIGGTNATYAYAKLDGIEGKLLKLTTLMLRYNLYITPPQLSKLVVDRNTRKLTKLSLYGTSCMYNFETIQILNSLLETSGSSLSLDMISGTAAALSYSVCQAFINNMNQLFSEGINDTMPIYKDGTQVISLSGVNYTVVMESHTNSAIKNRRLKDDVAVKIRVTSSNYTHFQHIFVNKTFKTAGITSPMQFGPSGLDIDNFDTELIAYLFANNRFTQQSSGYYYLNASVSLSPTANQYSFGIASLRNSHLLSPTYSVSLTTAVNFHLSLAYNDKLPLINVPVVAALANKAILKTNSYFNIYSYFNYITSSYSYTKNVVNNQVIQPKYTATLPSHIYAGGELGRIVWGVSSAANLENADGTTMSSINQKVMTKKDGQWHFELSQDTIAVRDGATSGTLTISYYIQRVEGTGNILATQTKSITITKHEDNYVEIGYDFFVEVDVYGGKPVLYKGAKIPQNIYYSLDIAPTTVRFYGSTYYLKTYPGGAATRYVVPASAIFESDRFIMMLYERRFKSGYNIMYNYNGGSPTQAGYIIRLEDIPTITEMNVMSYEPANLYFTTDTHITSIEGIQIFYMVDTVRIFHSRITDISPLASLNLIYFDYFNSIPDSTGAADAGKYNNNHTITDFSPLLEGSRDTLTTFCYAATASLQLIDINFVLSFPNLKTIILGAYYYISNVGISYFRTSSGKYLIGALAEKNAYIYVNQNNANIHSLPYDSTKSVRYNNSASYVCYALTVSTEYDIAREVLREYDTHSGFNNPYDNKGVTFKDGHILDFSPSGYSLNTINNTITFDLNTMIYTGGGYYFIDWYKASAELMINGYYLQEDITIDGTTYQKNVMLDKATAQKIADSITYFSAYKSGENCLKLSVSLQVNDLSKISQLNKRMVLRINYFDAAYERTLSLKFS